MSNKVAVLMSTFNGEKYLFVQIDTILNQKDVEVLLVARDDGSSDTTCTILENYAQKYSNVMYLKDDVNLGVGRSFITLLKSAPECDYYAYSDQDDIWHLDKLATAIKTIKDRTTPCLYCCNQNCVNGAGEFQHLRFSKEGMESNLVQAVFNNYYAGCTMVMNRKLRDVIIAPDRLPDMSFFKVRIHDAWTACVAYATGEVIFDGNAHMDFRRHDAAYSDEFDPGKKVSMFQTYKRKLERYKKRGIIKNSVRETATNILNSYADFVGIAEKNELELVRSYDWNMASKLRLINSRIFKDNIKGTKATAIYKVLAGVL